jgi:hypothetical protein
VWVNFVDLNGDISGVKGCLSEDEIINCEQFIEWDNCDNGGYYDDIMYRRCIWNDEAGEERCRKLKCSDYNDDEECANNEKHANENCFWNEDTCWDRNEIDYCNKLRGGSICINFSWDNDSDSGDGNGNGSTNTSTSATTSTRCEWVRKDCDLETLGYECVKKGTLESCCHYADGTNCSSGIITGEDGTRRACVWRGDGSGSGSEEGSSSGDERCEDFKCSDYSLEGDTDTDTDTDTDITDICINNEKNVSGGCILNGDGEKTSMRCENILDIQKCEDIKDGKNCRDTKDERNIFNGLEGKRCEWVKVGNEERCVENTNVSSCDLYIYYNDCNEGGIFDESDESFKGTYILFLFLKLHILCIHILFPMIYDL